jgi:hypothetical protein
MTTTTTLPAAPSGPQRHEADPDSSVQTVHSAGPQGTAQSTWAICRHCSKPFPLGSTYYCRTRPAAR